MHLQKGWDKMALRHIKAFGEDFDIVVNRSSKSLKITVEKQGEVIFSKSINGGDMVSVKL